MTQIGKKPRGFAVLTPEQRRAIASVGGLAAHALGKAHEWSAAEASAAAKAGHARKTAHEVTPEEARIAGSKGGKARAEKRRQRIAELASRGQDLENELARVQRA